MPDTNTNSSSTVNFGTAAFNGAVTGLIITSIKFGSNAQAAEVMDEEGNIIQVDMYGKKCTVNIEGTVSGGTTLALVPGAELTINSTTYKIESVEVTSTNTGHTSASITASAPIASSGTSSGGSGGSGGTSGGSGGSGT